MNCVRKVIKIPPGKFLDMRLSDPIVQLNVLVDSSHSIEPGKGASKLPNLGELNQMIKPSPRQGRGLRFVYFAEPHREVLCYPSIILSIKSRNTIINSKRKSVHPE